MWNQILIVFLGLPPPKLLLSNSLFISRENHIRAGLVSNRRLCALRCVGRGISSRLDTRSPRSEDDNTTFWLAPEPNSSEKESGR